MQNHSLHTTSSVRKLATCFGYIYIYIYIYIYSHRQAEYRTANKKKYITKCGVAKGLKKIKSYNSI
jgi:hypothetical protein